MRIKSWLWRVGCDAFWPWLTLWVNGPAVNARPPLRGPELQPLPRARATEMHKRNVFLSPILMSLSVVMLTMLFLFFISLCIVRQTLSDGGQSLFFRQHS